MKRKNRPAFWVFLVAFIFILSHAGQSEAIYVDPGDRFSLRLVTPIENNSGVSVWDSRYYPGDVLPLKMSDYLFRKMKEIHRVDATRLVSDNPPFWPGQGFSAKDMILKVCLEELTYKKKDTLGSKVYWDIVLHTYVYSGATGDLLFDSIIREKDDRQYVIYTDVLDTEPIYWEKFERTPYW